MGDSVSIVWEFKSRDRVFDTIRDKVLAGREKALSAEDLMQIAADVLLEQPWDYCEKLLATNDLIEIALLVLHGSRTIRAPRIGIRITPEQSLSMQLAKTLMFVAPNQPEIDFEETRELVKRLRAQDAAEGRKVADAHKKKRRERGLTDQAGDGKPATAVRLYSVGKKAGKKSAPAGESEEAKLHAILDNLPLGHSRIGGVPDLPRRKQWPTHKGKKLPFIAQLNLAELPKAAHELLPADGHLYVFARISNDEKKWPPPVSIMLHRGKADTLVRSALPKKSELWPAWKDALIDEIIPAAGKKSRVTVGWLYGKIDRNYGTAGELAEQEFLDGDDWINLLGIKSVGSMQWSDYGDLNVIIRRSALEKLDFSNVLAMALSS